MLPTEACFGRFHDTGSWVKARPRELIVPCMSCFERELTHEHETNEWCGMTHKRHSRSPFLVGTRSRHLGLSVNSRFFMHQLVKFI